MAVEQAEKFNVARALQMTFAPLQRHGVPLGLLLLLLVALPQALVGWWLYSIGASEQAVNLSSNLLNATTGTIASNTIVHVALGQLSDRPFNLAESLRAAVRFWPAAFGIALLSGLGILVGLVLLIVPGVFLAICWCVAIPVRMAEGGRGESALSRSMELTKGSRWRILGVLLVAFAAFFVALVAYGFSSEALARYPALDFALIWPLLSVAMALFGATGSAAIYHELVHRDDQPAEKAASIFD